jgi:hypothetical protein
MDVMNEQLNPNDLTQVRVDWDEWYPVFFIVDREEVEAAEEEITLTQLDLDFILQAVADFERAQQILKEALHTVRQEIRRNRASW